MPSAHPPQTLAWTADAVLDAAGTLATPGAILAQLEPSSNGPVPRGRLRLLAAGTPEHLAGHPAWKAARRLDLPGHVLIPPLVNAHTHLDLTGVGPVERRPGHQFDDFLRAARAKRPLDKEGIRAAVARGVELSLAGGVAAVGDIAGAAGGAPTIEPFLALLDSPLMGVSFMEFFAIGTREGPALERLEKAARELAAVRAPGAQVRPGLQPHAPYTVSPRGYAKAAALAAEYDLPLSTHLAESPAERSFIAKGTGPIRAMLEEFGLVNDALLGDMGRGRSPVAHTAASLPAGSLLLAAHANDASDKDLEILAARNVSIVYCPRCAAYFDAPKDLGPHRYRAMLARGINVALGTDSIMNLPPGTGRLSTLDEMRVLYANGERNTTLLLAMGTTHGAKALGLDPNLFSFARFGPIAGVAAVPISPGRDPPAGVMENSSAPRLLALGLGT